MEGTKTFNIHSDKQVYTIMDEDNVTPVLEICGYDLDFKFNMDKINSLEDAENVTTSLAQIMFKLLTEQLILERNQG